LQIKLQKEYGKHIESIGYEATDFNQVQWTEQRSKDWQDSIYEIYGANDTYTRDFISVACRDWGMRIIAEYPSPFAANGLPPSTLYTYHAPQIFYLIYTRNPSDSSH
jgi:hypothetical protein